MFDWVEISLFGAAVALLIGALIPRLRAYRSLFLAGFVLLLSTAMFRRRTDLFGNHLSAGGAGAVQLPAELFGIAWWVLGAWLVRNLLTRVLRRTLFPNDNQPHARRLFADLASGLVYVVAFVGIMDTVLKEPISAVLATSGVLAIVLGLALQNTLADVFSGLAINVERPFGAGDWITLSENVEGQVIEINWRATRLRTASNDIIVIPNSVIAKSVVTNHRRLNDPHLCTVRLKIDHTVSTAHVIDALQIAAAASRGIASSSSPIAYACDFVDSMIAYEIYFGVDDFTLTPGIRSDVIKLVTDALKDRGIPIGSAAMDVRIVQNAVETVPTLAPASTQPSCG
jgi:small-conductance mechanosensitive channel